MGHRVTQVEEVDLCVIRWYNNIIITCLSTLHGCELIDSAERWSLTQEKHSNTTTKDYRGL